MNNPDRLAAVYEQIIHNQAVTHERLQVLIGLLIFGVLVGLVVLGLVIWVLTVKVATRRDIADMKETLSLVKDYTYSARSHSKDAQLALQDVKQATAAIAHPSREEKEIAKAVEQIPDRTADKVVERLSGDELKKLLLPLAAVAGLAGATFAGPRADAAEELRQRNAAAATAWAGGENP